MSERWWIARGERDVVQAIAPLDIAAWMARAGDGVLLSSDRQSRAVRLDHDGGVWFVKWRHTLPGRRAKTLGRPGRERREQMTAGAARARGIPALHVSAVGERRRLGALVGSVLVRRYDVHARVATDVLRQEPAHVEPLGSQMAAWHARGWRHGDAYPKNLLQLVDHATFAPIGHPHARFVTLRPGARDAAGDPTRQRDLAQIVIGLEALDPSLVTPFLTAYGRVAGSSAGELRHGLGPTRERILARKAERLRTRPLREPDGPPPPTPIVAPAGRVRVEPW